MNNSRQGSEIEVSPEMIEAGFSVLKASGLADEYSKADRYTVAEIFRAMAAASGQPVPDCQQKSETYGENELRNQPLR